MTSRSDDTTLYPSNAYVVRVQLLVYDPLTNTDIPWVGVTTGIATFCSDALGATPIGGIAATALAAVAGAAEIGRAHV